MMTLLCDVTMSSQRDMLRNVTTLPDVMRLCDVMLQREKLQTLQETSFSQFIKFTTVDIFSQVCLFN